jgi:hypothetical protein
MIFRSALPLLFALAVSACSPRHEAAQNPSTYPSWQTLSGQLFEHWQGLDATQDSSEATLQGSGEAVFRYPVVPKGWIKHGFRLTNDGPVDWHECEGLQFAPGGRRMRRDFPGPNRSGARGPSWAIPPSETGSKWQQRSNRNRLSSCRSQTGRTRSSLWPTDGARSTPLTAVTSGCPFSLKTMCPSSTGRSGGI